MEVENTLPVVTVQMSRKHLGRFDREGRIQEDRNARQLAVREELGKVG